MALDAEGYGYGSHEEGLERLLTDARVLSPAGIERAAWGWDRHEDPAAMQRFHEAERVALRALEQTDRGPTWKDARRGILDLTEGRTTPITWKTEHSGLGHTTDRETLRSAF